MVTMKVCVNKQRFNPDQPNPVYIRVTHDRRSAYIKTDKLVSRKGVSSKFEVTDPFVVDALSARIVDYADRLNRVDISRWSVQEVVEFLRQGDAEISFSDYARRFIDAMINEGHVRNAKNYKLALDHLEHHHPDH